MIWLAISAAPSYRSFRAAALAIGALLIVLALLPGPFGLATGRSERCTSSRTCRDVLALATGGHIPYYRSLPLARNENVRRVVVVVQGATRHANRYYDRLVAAARAEGRLFDTALFAPNFRTAKDHPDPGEHYWSSGGWKIGHKSRDAREDVRTSSFAVMNDLLARICAGKPPVFPELDTLVVVGHSAGGQFVNRYVAGGAGCPTGAVHVRYVVMNPSSYLYVDGRRRSPASGLFKVPKTACKGYDEYKYGLQDLNAYMRSVGVERIRANLFSRATTYLVGAKDTSRSRRGRLDTRCPAELQGRNRLVRFRNYRAYAKLFLDWTGSRFEIVPGIGHSSSRMLMSEAARRVIFR